MADDWKVTRAEPPPVGELVLVKDPHGSYALAVRALYNQGTSREDGHGAYLDWEREPEVWHPLPEFPGREDCRVRGTPPA